MSETTNSLIPKAGVIEVPDPPTITAVEFIKQVIENINEQISPLDQEVYKASFGDTSFVKALFDSVHEIKSRADQAFMILTQIAADPQTLEVSNARLEPQGETFQGTHKLIDAVKELEKELREGEYDYFRVVAELLTDVQGQMERYKSFVATPHIGLIKRKVEAIENELRRQLQWCFREIGPFTSSEKYEQEIEDQEIVNTVDLTPLQDVSQVIDALGEKFRLDLLERFSQLQLIPYEKLFKHGTKYSGLDYLDQRYAWFRRLLHVVEVKLSGILPERYKVGYHLFLEFQRRTKNHLAEELTQCEKEYNPQADDSHSWVGKLIKSIKSVMAFEAEVLSSFDVKSRFDEEEGEKKDSQSIPLSIRDAFDPFLGPYVQLEKKGLEDLMVVVMREEEASNNTLISQHTPASANGAPPAAAAAQAVYEPFESSTKLFEYIKGSLKRCQVFSTGLTFLSLSKEFRLALQQYAESLKFRCPSPAIPARGKHPPVYVLQSKAMESSLCRILATCEYCIDIVPSLETIMKSKIRSMYSDQIEFTPQIDAFMDTMSFSMNILALGEVNRMENDFEEMRRLNWTNIDTVHDSGDHIKHMIRILSDCIPRIRKYLSPSYFLNMCMKLIGVFLDAFLENIYALRRISKTGGGQLLLDLNTIKEFLLTMPNVRIPADKPQIDISKVYVSVVNNKVKKVENILKLVCTDDAMLEEMFGLLWPDATKEDMDAIHSLKGNKSIIAAIAPLDNMGDMLKDGAKNMHKGTMQNLNKGVTKITGGMKNVFGDIMSGNLFTDGSTHSNEAQSNHGPAAHSGTSGGSGTSGAKQGLSKAMTGMTAALAFKKVGSGINTSQSGSGGSAPTGGKK
eukprot:gene7510-8307_t